MKKVILAAVITALAPAANAYLPEGNWYTRVGLGITIPDAEAAEEVMAEQLADDRGITEEVEFDYPRGYNFNLGYRLNRFIAFEVGLTNMGEEKKTFSYAEFEGNLETDGYEQVEVDTYHGKISGSAKTLAAVFSTSTNRALSGGVRAGYAFWNTRAKVNYRLERERLELTEDDEVVQTFYSSNTETRLDEDLNGSDPFAGVFINWRINKWTYSLEHNLFKTDETEQSVSSISLSMDF